MLGLIRFVLRCWSRIFGSLPDSVNVVQNFRDEEQHWFWVSFGSSWDADSEYVVHYLIPLTSCRISRLKVKSKAKMALFRTKIFRDEEQHWCWVSFGSSWDADSEYVVHHLIPWTSCRISRLKVKSEAKMTLFRTKILGDEEKHSCCWSFCLSWDAESEYVNFSLPDDYAFPSRGSYLWESLNLLNSSLRRPEFIKFICEKPPPPIN